MYYFGDMHEKELTVSHAVSDRKEMNLCFEYQYELWQIC
jgi:hypothetical protein